MEDLERKSSDLLSQLNSMEMWKMKEMHGLSCFRKKNSQFIAKAQIAYF